MRFYVGWPIVEFEDLAMVRLGFLDRLLVLVRQMASTRALNAGEEHLSAERIFDEVLQFASDFLRTSGCFGFFGLGKFWRGVAHGGMNIAREEAR